MKYTLVIVPYSHICKAMHIDTSQVGMNDTSNFQECIFHVFNINIYIYTCVQKLNITDLPTSYVCDVFVF